MNKLFFYLNFSKILRVIQIFFILTLKNSFRKWNLRFLIFQNIHKFFSNKNQKFGAISRHFFDLKHSDENQNRKHTELALNFSNFFQNILRQTIFNFFDPFRMTLFIKFMFSKFSNRYFFTWMLLKSWIDWRVPIQSFLHLNSSHDISFLGDRRISTCTVSRNYLVDLRLILICWRTSKRWLLWNLKSI